MQARATSSISPSFAPKLGHRDAVEIKGAHAAGASPGELARVYGIARSSTHGVLRGARTARSRASTPSSRSESSFFAVTTR